MLRRTPLFSALAPQAMASGVQMDRQRLLKVLWEEAQGVRFYDGKVRYQWGDDGVRTFGTARIRGLDQQQLSDGRSALWIASGSRIFRDIHGVTEEIDQFGNWIVHQSEGSMPTFYDFAFVGDWCFINSGQGVPHYFNGTAIVPTTDFPGDVVQLIKKYNFLLALGTGSRKTGVSWSDADNVLQWTPSRTNLAGNVYIDEFDSPIICGAKLGEHIAVYSANQLALVTFIGQPFFFGQRTVLTGFGPSGKKAVAGDGRLNVGFGRNGAWLTDGNEYHIIDKGWMHDYLQENVNWDQAGKVVVARNQRSGMYDFTFPMRDSLVNNESWAFDASGGGWGPLQPFDYMMEQKIFEWPIVSRAPASLQNLERAPYTHQPLVLKTKPLLMQVQGPDGLADVHTDSKIDEVELLMRDVVHVEFRLGAAQDLADTPVWSDWTLLTNGKQLYQIDLMPSGVYHFLEFRNTEEQWTLDLQGFMLFGLLEGSKRNGI